MDDRVVLKIYCYGQILLETYEGVQFVCENSLDVVILFTLSLDELKCVICEKIHSERSRRISCILYRYPLPVFGGFVHFQTKYVTDEASIQEIFSMYIENRQRISCIELYIEFEQSEADRNIELEDYDSDSEEDFESNYEIVGPGEDEDGADGTMNADVAEVANSLANSLPFQEPSFMRSLDLEAMNAPEFPQYMNAELPVVADGEFMVAMEFSSREEVIKAMKDYTIRRGVDYRVYEPEPATFYAKYAQYSKCCDWLIRSTISQDHSKLDSKTVAEAIKPLVEVRKACRTPTKLYDPREVTEQRQKFPVHPRTRLISKQNSTKQQHYVTLYIHLNVNIISQHYAIFQTPKPRQLYKASSTFFLPRCNSKLVQALGLHHLKRTHCLSCNRKTICRQTENHCHIFQRHRTLTNRKMKCVRLRMSSLNQSINHC
ncbi:hypothetical protein Ahy_B10g105377 [Arachis hypogaea]|uniref:Transposase MuDR plant domain-containing protein n=1 Tax=Arachis hypogaea TaxID=3818 RepID=A0A444X897_ARAHY|nr:hypothetical protein Ahy_B10g105377 [Arachis hypogaea]